MKYMAEITKYPGVHRRIASADTATQIDDSYIKDGNAPAVAATLIVEDNDMRITYDGTTPTNTGNKIGFVVLAGQSFRLANIESIQNLQYINDVSGSNAVFQFCPEFDEPVN